MSGWAGLSVRWISVWWSTLRLRQIRCVSQGFLVMGVLCSVSLVRRLRLRIFGSVGLVLGGGLVL